MRCALLTLHLDYDETLTDPEAVASVLDSLLETAMSTPGVLDEVGNPQVTHFNVGSISRMP